MMLHELQVWIRHTGSCIYEDCVHKYDRRDVNQRIAVLGLGSKASHIFFGTAE